jgi:hypothetical protein
MPENVGYTKKQVVDLLGMYSDFCYGNFSNPISNDGKTTNNSAFRANFELPIQGKCDLDMAIDSMGVKGCWREWCKDIEQHPAGYNLTPKQYKVAQFVRGVEDVEGTIPYIASEIADILTPKTKKLPISRELLVLVNAL